MSETEQVKTAGWTRRRVVTHAVASLIVAAGVTAGSVYLLGGATSANVTAAAIAAVLIVGGFYAFRVLAKPLGRLTATAALSLTGATVLGGYAALTPHCPDRMDLARCGTPEIASWALTGAAVPVTYILLLGLPLLSIGLSARGLHHLKDKGAQVLAGRRA